MLSSSVCIVSDHLLISLAYDLGLLQEIQDEIYLSMRRTRRSESLARNVLLNDLNMKCKQFVCTTRDSGAVPHSRQMCDTRRPTQSKGKPQAVAQRPIL